MPAFISAIGRGAYVKRSFRAYFAVAGSLMAPLGLVGVLVNALTSWHPLLETERSTSDRISALSGSQAYKIHISTVGRGNKSWRQITATSRVICYEQHVNDDREDSTEDIVRNGDWELDDIRHAVY